MSRQGLRSLKWLLLLLLALILLAGGGISGYRYLRYPPLPSGSQRFAGNRQHVCGLAFSPDGKRLITAGWDRYVRVFDRTTGKQMSRSEWFTHSLIGMAHRPHSEEIALTSERYPLVRWNCATQQEMLPQLLPVSIGAYIAYSPDGKYLATSGRQNGTVVVWNLDTGNTVLVLGGHKGYAAGIAFSPDSKQLATVSRDAVFLWDIASGQKVRSWSGSYLNFVRFSPDGQYLAYGGALSSTYIVSLKQPLRRATLENASIQQVIFSMDSRTLIAARGGTLLAYDTDGRYRGVIVSDVRLPDFLMRIIPKLRQLKRPSINCMTFSPDGRDIAFSFSETVVIQPVSTLKIP